MAPPDEPSKFDDNTTQKIAATYAALDASKGPVARAAERIGRVIDALTGRRARRERERERAMSEAIDRARRWGGSAPPA